MKARNRINNWVVDFVGDQYGHVDVLLVVLVVIAFVLGFLVGRVV